MKKNIFISLKSYTDYFAVFIKSDTASGYYELSEDNPLPIEFLSKAMMSYTSVIFDRNLHDISLLTCALGGASCQQIHNLSTKISNLNEENSIFDFLRQENINIKKEWDYINLNGSLGDTDNSLILYAARMHRRTLIVSPTGANRDKEFTAKVREYCESACDTLMDLYKELESKIELRSKMSLKAGIDFRSCSNAKIAEESHKAVLGNIYSDTKYNNIRYTPPDNIRLNSGCLADLIKAVSTYEYKLDSDGKIINNDNQPSSVTIGGNEYKLGLGGLHSTEKSRVVYPDKGKFLVEIDVTSYYPSIILANKYSPAHLGDKFLDLYQRFLDNRLKAIATDDQDASDIYKIIINGVFGKFGSKYSMLYSPELLLQTTLTGQLSLLMLIETAHAYGFKVVSANTDSLVVEGDVSQRSKLQTLMSLWELHTGYNLKTEELSAIYSESVNSYIAIKTSGELKRKGAFAEESITRNPFSNICKKAVINYIQDGTPIVDTVLGLRNLQTDYINVSTSKHGMTFKGVEQGTVCRWYYAKHEDSISCSKTGSRIPKSTGATPLMDFNEVFVDIDYPRYVSESYELLSKLGVDTE